jgi:hypothetical protein
LPLKEHRAIEKAMTRDPVIEIAPRGIAFTDRSMREKILLELGIEQMASSILAHICVRRPRS